ncbi:MAG: MATE family efflux transporter [Clostridia bacterium]|nr:MATE family efflux transporter [Clostridia bacterium]
MTSGEYLLSTENLKTAFVKLAIPALLTTLISQIYNLTDTYFIGMLQNTAMLSAVSLAMPIMWLLNALTGIIAAGAPQLISIKDGAGEKEASIRCRSFAVLGTLILCIIIIPIAMVTINPVLSLLTKDTAVISYATEYLHITIAASILSSVSSAIQGVLRARGRTKHAGIASMAGIVTNICLDPLLIFVFNMGMRGAGLATALGAAISLVMCFFYIRGEISVKKFFPSVSDIALICKLSLASTVSSVITALSVSASFAMASSLSSNTMASIAVASKVYSTVISVISAIAFSIQPFIGYNYSSGNHIRLVKVLSISSIIGEIMGVISTLVFLFGGGMLMRLFTNDSLLVAFGTKMLRLLAIGLPVVAIQMNCMCYMSATGKAMHTLGISLTKQILSVFLMMLLQHFWNETGLMLSYPITEIVVAIPSVLLCFGEIARMSTAQKPSATCSASNR